MDTTGDWKNDLIRVFQLAGFSENDSIVITEKFTPEQFPKGATLLHQGQICDFIGFIQSGYAKILHRGKDRTEYVRYFGKPVSFLTCLQSFMSGAPSVESICALTPLTLAVITKSDYNDLVAAYPHFAAILLTFQTNVLHEVMLEKNTLLPLSAKDRYTLFLELHTPLNNYTTVKDVASYLGIKRQSLSRIRRLLVQDTKNW